MAFKCSGMDAVERDMDMQVVCVVVNDADPLMLIKAQRLDQPSLDLQKCGWRGVVTLLKADQ